MITMKESYSLDSLNGIERLIFEEVKDTLYWNFDYRKKKKLDKKLLDGFIIKNLLHNHKVKESMKVLYKNSRIDGNVIFRICDEVIEDFENRN